MEPFADANCILKVNVHCDSCKMKMMQVLQSVRGVYSLTIEAQEGIVKVCGEVDPRILLRALSRSGQHAELVWAKVKHPALTSRNQYERNDGSYGHGYNNNYYRALEGPYDYHHSNALPEPSSYYSTRRDLVEQPYYDSTYCNSSPYARYESSSSSYPYQPYVMDHVIREEPMNWCSIL